MIEKFNSPSFNVHDIYGRAQTAASGTIFGKINEVIDVVNTLIEENNIHEKQIDELQMRVEPQKCEPADPYAEQRKWVGCLCRFWDDNFKITKHFGILTRIDETAIVRYEAENGFWYCACEPVKPTDNAIYKGGDNE